MAGVHDSGPGRGAVARRPRGRGGFEADAKAPGPSGSRWRRALGVSVVLAALFGSCPAASKAGAKQGAGQQGAVPRYPVDVRAVALDVLVTDRKGRFAQGLKAEDFRVLECGVPQELTFFTASRTPVTIVLLLDSSASVRSNLLSVQKAANRFIDKLDRGDRARIGFFHERVVFGPRFTDDMDEHSAIIRQMRPQRSTHLYDALVESFEVLEPVPRRKALLVFSDGEDQGSRAPMEGALEAARRSHASVYSVGLLGWSSQDGMYTNQELLEQIARLTGGRAFFPGNDKEMRKAFDRVRAELHHQYRMGYVPRTEPAGGQMLPPGTRSRQGDPVPGRGGEGGPGQWREIQVELPRHEDLVVRCRLGYFNDGSPAP
jgi:Ca-activated chloride channel family protein